VLTGKVSPSGKLVTTFPMTYADVPSAATFPGRELVGKPPLVHGPFAGKPSEVVYEEGIYVGYRYYNTFRVKPAYEFGYGLSYTSFGYGDIVLSSTNGGSTIGVMVKNTGRVPGREVVQVYISAPNKKLKKPQSELKAFAKTKMLAPGESQMLRFSLTMRDLASYDPACSCWIAEAGTYTVNIGASSLDFRSSAKFEIGEDVIVEKSKVTLPRANVKEIEATK